jgi:short-subunit dehydrogenase
MYKLSSQYPSKRAFITGAGSGLGKAFALRLAKEGWAVAMTDISDTNLNNAAQEVNNAGGKAFSYVFDVSDKVKYKEAFDDFTSKNGGIDLLINNAGVGDGAMFGDYALEHWDWITGINQQAVIYGSHFATLMMKKQRSGHIISIASMAGIANMPNMAMYNVTKAAVISLSESMYAELKPFNVDVSVVLPTFFRSNIMQHNKGNKNSTEIGKKLIEKAPLTPDYVADLILKKAGNKKFYIYLPLQAHLVQLLKRFSPTLFLKIKASMFAKKEWVKKLVRESKAD